MILLWREFLVDIPSFLAWVESTYGGTCVGKGDPLGLTLMRKDAGEHVPFTDSQKTAIKAQWKSLNQTDETAKRALPSRKKLKDKLDFEASVKSYLAGKDWSALTSAERKFLMGGALNNSEYDTLKVS